VAQPRSDDALVALAEAIRDDGVKVPGVSAPLPEAERFARAFEAASGRRASQLMSQRIYRLTEVRAVRTVHGGFRVAGGEDRDRVVRWLREFQAEALPPGHAATDTEKLVDVRLPAGDFFLWIDRGEPVSVSGWSDSTPQGARIGPVYTPPVLRRRGYGTALVAAQSAEMLRRGKRFCFLYTDLTNPTSNKIYMDIGYEPVCDAAEFTFEAVSESR
jgi:predicted GNAT family acetyltransferase